MEKGAKGKLEIFEADLLKEGSFDKAMLNCELVMHTASPFFIQGVKDPEKELIEPAKKGTRNVLESAIGTRSVKRVVLSVAWLLFMATISIAKKHPMAF